MTAEAAGAPSGAPTVSVRNVRRGSLNHKEAGTTSSDSSSAEATSDGDGDLSTSTVSVRNIVRRHSHDAQTEADVARGPYCEAGSGHAHLGDAQYIQVFPEEEARVATNNGNSWLQDELQINYDELQRKEDELQRTEHLLRFVQGAEDGVDEILAGFFNVKAEAVKREYLRALFPPMDTATVVESSEDADREGRKAHFFAKLSEKGTNDRLRIEFFRELKQWVEADLEVLKATDDASASDWPGADPSHCNRMEHAAAMEYSEETVYAVRLSLLELGVSEESMTAAADRVGGSENNVLEDLTLELEICGALLAGLLEQLVGGMLL